VASEIVRYATGMGRAASQRRVNRLVAEIEADDKRREIVVRRAPCDLPAPGWHRAICVDVCDLGVIDTPYGPRATVEFTFEFEGRRQDGRRHVLSQRFSKSLHISSQLSRFLQVWQGYAFGADDLTHGVQLVSRYLMRPAHVLVELSASRQAYRRIVTAVPLEGGTPMRAEGAYVRRCLRGGAGRRAVPTVQMDEPCQP